MSTDQRIERVKTLYEQAIFSGDAEALAEASRGLDAVEADIALARGRVLHGRFLIGRAAGSSPAEDPAELAFFERALESYRARGDTRGEGDASFWVGCVHQVIRRDDETAIPRFERARDLAAKAGDKVTEAEALRHLGIAAHTAGRLDEARELLERSSRLRRETGALTGVAANMVGLAYIAAAQGRRADALAVLAEARDIAEAHDAHTIASQIEQARTTIEAEDRSS